MLDFKCWYESRAMWGGLVAVVSGVAAAYGYQLDPGEEKTLIDLLTAITASVGGLLALWGRFSATTKIGAPPKEQQ